MGRWGEGVCRTCRTFAADNARHGRAQEEVTSMASPLLRSLCLLLLFPLVPAPLSSFIGRRSGYDMHLAIRCRNGARSPGCFSTAVIPGYTGVSHTVTIGGRRISLPWNSPLLRRGIYRRRRPVGGRPVGVVGRPPAAGDYRDSKYRLWSQWLNAIDKSRGAEAVDAPQVEQMSASGEGTRLLSRRRDGGKQPHAEDDRGLTFAVE
mmetsp:Transcript_32301/g.80000  ORF Transcript_32301/g.80000 Transcript_32301/m.80000 type:complete len:206 (-) Transcript_32301:629-1246(-)